VANRKRVSFRADGPFIIRRSCTISGVDYVVGQCVTRDDLQISSDRKAEALFESNWFDVASPEAVAAPDADVAKTEQVPAPVAAVEPDMVVTGGSGADVAPEAVTDAAPASGGEVREAGDGGSPAKPATDQKPAAYKAFGFGRYYAIDAAGEKFGSQLSKSQAQGLAARDGVKLLGLSEGLEG
jgi:hypothetical protein